MKAISTAVAAVLVAASVVVSSSTPAIASPGATHRQTATPALSPHVSVQPSTGLTVSSTVQVAAFGLPADTSVDIVECNIPTSQDDEGTQGCPILWTLTTASDGSMSIQLNPRNLVFRSSPFGDPVPVYCRADICRYYVEWTAGGHFHSIHTRKMNFVGSPATISVTPASGLVDGQRVHVSGSAVGSTGDYVTIVEESCFSIIQGSGCNGALPLATFKLTPKGTYSGSVSLFRVLGDGEDCVDAMFGCELSAVVLNDEGQADDSFGLSRIGRPAATLTFS